MPQDQSKWFETDDYRNDAEREFIEALRSRAVTWQSLGLSPDDTDVIWEQEGDKLALAVDIGDPERDFSLRTLAIEFDGAGVAVGKDETGQMATHLDVTRPDVLVRRDAGGTPTLFASFAADWIERELRRPIELHEWMRGWFPQCWWLGGFRHRRWVFADTKKAIVWSDSSNNPRPHLGPPDRITVVRDFSKA